MATHTFCLIISTIALLILIIGVALTLMAICEYLIIKITSELNK